MKKIKLNKKLFLNKDVVSNLNGVQLNGIQGGTVENCQPAIPNHDYFSRIVHQHGGCLPPTNSCVVCPTGGCSGDHTCPQLTCAYDCP